MLPFKLKNPYTRRPPGGWHMQRDGQILKGDTPEELEENVRAYLIQNGKAPGNVADEITMFCHTHWPHLTEPNLDHVELSASQMGRSEIQSKVFEWLGKMVLKPHESPPTKQEAEERTKTCTACKFNKPYRPEDVLYEPIRRKVFLMNKGIMPSGLGWCAKWHIDCRLACHWAKDLLGPADAKEASCWRE